MSTEAKTRKHYGFLPVSGRALFFSGLILVVLLLGGFFWLLFQPGGDGPASGIPIGQAAPNFSLTDASGHTVQLSSFRGHPLIINFWASYCAPCQSETPMLEQFYQDHQSQGLVILGINEGEPNSNITQYIQAYNITYPVLSDRTLQFTDPSSYDPTPLPRTYFIDKAGIVRASYPGALSPQILQADYQKISG